MLGFTIDSITLFISWEELTTFDFLRLRKLTRSRKTKKNGKTWRTGFHKKMRVSYNKEEGIYISGSISNYYTGYTSLLQYSELQTAIEQLGNELKLNLHSAKLYRLDIALTFQTDKNIEQYTHHLFCDITKFERLEQVDGVRFQTNSIVIAIYNKAKEIFEKRGLKISSNTLRIELRIKKGLSGKLGIKNCEIQDLYSIENYKKVISLFQEYYQKIKKKTVPKELAKMDNIASKKFKEFLLRHAIEQIFGSEKDAYRMIEQLDKKGQFKNANDKSKTKKIITDLSSNTLVSELHPLVVEINQKVELACNEIINT
jgi:hypothetical protein